MDAVLQQIAFGLFSLLGIAGGLGLVLFRNPVHAALSLIVNFFSIAGLYLSLHAEFIAVIQILVYAGAIMVLFLFVIMLLNLQDEMKQKFDTTKGIAFIIGVAFVAEMAYIFRTFSNKTVDSMAQIQSGAPKFTFGKVEKIGELMMTDYLFPFEMISVVLLAALIGAIVVAKKYSYDN